MKTTKLDEPTIVRKCLEALCEYVERTGTLVFPVQINSTKSNVYPLAPRGGNSLNETSP